MDRFRTALQHRLHDREDIDFSDVGVPEDTSPTAKQNTMIARAAREAVQEMLDNNPNNLPSGNSNANNSTAFYLNTLYNRNKNNDNVSVKSNTNNNVQQEGETQEEKNHNVTKNDNAEKQEANNNNAENFAAFQRQLSLHRHRRKLMQTADNIVANSVDPLFRTIVEKTKGKRFNNAICVVVSASTFSRSVLSLHMERRGWTCICVSKTSSSSPPITTASTSTSTDQTKNNTNDQSKGNEKNDDGEEILRQSLKEIEKKFRYGQHGVKFAGKAKLGDAFDLNFTQEGENNNNHNDEENRQKDSKTTLTFPKIRLVLIDSFTHESPQESAHNIRNLLVSLRIEAASDEIEAQRRKRQQLFYENLTYGIHNHNRGSSSSDEQQSNLYFQHHREDPLEKEKREKMEAQFANDQKEEGMKEAQQIVVVQLTQIRSDGGRGLQLPNFVEPDPEGFERAIISQVTLNNNTGKNNNNNNKSSSTSNISPTRRKKSSSFVNAQSQQQQQKQKQQQQQKQQDPNSLLLALLSKVDVIVRSAFTSTLAEKISSFFLTEAARSRSRIVNVTSVYDSIRGILGGVSSRRFDAGDEIIGEMYDCFSPSSDLIQEVFKLKKKQDEEIQKQQEKKSASSRRGSLMFSPNANEHALIPPLLLASNSQKPSAAFTTNFSFGSAPLSPPQQQQLDLETAAKNGKNNNTGNFSDSGSLLSLQTLQKNRTAVGNKNDPLTFLSFESDPRFVVLRAHYQHMRKLLERTNEEVKGKDRRIRKMQDEVGALADEVKNLSATQSGIGVAALLSIPRQTEDVAVSTADDEEAMGQGSWLQEKNRLLERVTKSEAKAKRLQDQLQQGANARKQQMGLTLLTDGPDVVDPNLLSSSSPQQNNNNVSSAAVRSLRNKIQDLEEKLQDLQTERNLLKEVADTAQKQWFEMAGSASARMESSLRGSVVFAGAEAQRQAGRGALVIGGAAFSNVSSLVDQLKQQASKIKHASVWKKGLREMLRVAECSAMAALDVDANFQRSTFRRPTIVGDGGNRRNNNNNNNTNQNQRSNSFGIFSGSSNNNSNHSPENAKISSRASSFRHQQQQNKSRNNSSRAKKSKNLVSWGSGEDGSMSDSFDENDEEEDDEQNNSSNFDSGSENSEPFASSCPNDLLRKHKQNLRSKKSGDSHHKKKATSKKHSEHRVSRKSVSGDEKNQSQSNNNSNNNNANGGDYLLSTQDPLLNPDYMPPGVDEKLLNDTSYHYPKSDKKRVQKKKSAGVVEQNFADVSQRSSSSRRKGKKEKTNKLQQELLSSSSNKDYYYRDRKKSSSYNPNIAAAATGVTSCNRGRSQFYYGLAEPPEEYDTSEDDYDGSSSSSSCDDTAASESKNNKSSRRQQHRKKKRATNHNNSQRPHHHQVHEAYQKLEALSKNLSEMFQHVVDYTEQAAEARRVGLDGLFEAVVRVASKATKLNDPNKVVRLRASVDEKQKSLDEILSRPLGADAGSMAALRSRGDEFFHHYLERYHLVAELRRLEESCNVQHSSRVKEHLLRGLLQAQNRMDEVGSYLLNNNELFMYAESRMEVFKLLQELAPWITSEEYDLLQREGKSAIAEMMAQCQIARTTTVDDDAVLAQQKMTVLEEEQKAAAATAKSNPNKRRLSVSIAQFERTAKALTKNVTNNNNNGGSSGGRNVNEDQDQEEVPSQELASELDKEISRFVLDEGVDAIRDILKQLRGMWERDENISNNNNNNLQSPPSSPLFSPKNKNITIIAPASSPVTLTSPISGSLAGSTTQNNSKSLHYIVNNWKRDATRMVLQTAEEIGRSIEEFKKREKQSQEFIDVTGFDIRPFNKMILQRLLHDPFAVSASAQQSASNNNNNLSSIMTVPNSTIQNNSMNNNNNNSVVVSAASAAADPSATNVRIVSTVEAFREASLLLHDQLRRLLLQLKRRTPLTKIKIVDFAAELNLHKKKRLRQTSEFPGLMCVDAELVSRFADYFESETKGQYLIARSNFKVRAGEMMKSAHTQTTALQAIEEQAKSSLLLTSANAYRRSNHNGENNSPRKPNFDESVKRLDASAPQQVNLLQTLKEEDEKIAVAKSSATKHYFNNNTNHPHGNKSSEQQQQESQFGALSMNPNSPGHFAKMLPDGSISIQFMKNFGKQVKFSGKPSSATATTMLTLEYERATTPSEEENNDKEKPKTKSSTVGVQVVTTAIIDENNNNNNNNSEERNGQNESLPPLLSPHSPKPPSQPLATTTTGNGFTRSSINQKILEKQIEEQKQASYFGPSRKKLLWQEQKEQEEKEMVLKQFVPLPAITKLTQQLFVGNEKNIMSKKRVTTSNTSARQIRQQEATISQTTRRERGREDEENKERHDEVDDDEDDDDDDDDQGKQIVVPTKNPQLNHQPEQAFAQIVRELPWSARVHSSQEQSRNPNIQHHSYDSKKRFLLATAETTYGSTSENGTIEKQNNSIPCLPTHQKGPKSRNNKKSKNLPIPAVLVYPSRQMALAPTIKGSDGKELVSGGVGYNLVVVDDE